MKNMGADVCMCFCSWSASEAQKLEQRLQAKRNRAKRQKRNHPGLIHITIRLHFGHQLGNPVSPKASHSGQSLCCLGGESRCHAGLEHCLRLCSHIKTQLALALHGPEGMSVAIGKVTITRSLRSIRAGHGGHTNCPMSLKANK